MTTYIDKHQYFIEGDAAFMAALEDPAGPDVGAMLDALVSIVTTTVYYMPYEDDDSDSECGPTGTVFTVGKSTPVAGVTYDFEVTPARISETDLVRLEAGWAAIESLTDADTFDDGLDLLEELRDFVTDEASQ